MKDEEKEAAFEKEHRGRGGRRGKHSGAKTFRRGRAIEFLGRMHDRRDTLKRQLQAPEYASVQPVLVGELKAVEMVIDEFIRLFEIREDEVAPEEEQDQMQDNKKTEGDAE